MAVFSTNQVRHFYVVTNTAGATQVGGISTATETADGKSFYFKYLGNGGLIRTDLIDYDKIEYVKGVTAAKQVTNPAGKVITLNTDANNGSPIVGQEYVLNVRVFQAYGMSDEETFEIAASAKAKSNVASDLYINLAIALANNANMGYGSGITVMLKDSSSLTAVPKKSKANSFSGTYTGICVFTEVPDWKLGTMQGPDSFLEAFGDVVIDNGEEVNPFDVEDAINTTVSIPNSKKVADLEYFCMGERGDIYRMKGWPNVIPTSYLVNPNNASGYHLVDIAFAYQGDAEDIQKSPRTITLAFDASQFANKEAVETALQLNEDIDWNA